MTEELTAARRWFSEELRYTAHVSSRAVLNAFATVPRELFVGPGPWRITGIGGYWTTESDDPRSVYHDVLIALDEALHINNGQPSLYAFLFDKLGVSAGERVLHLGCGTGYYTAILAELVGPTGKITAFEIHGLLAEKARTALTHWPWVSASNTDAASVNLEPADVIVASAGASHPLPAWLDALKPGGRLLFPITATDGTGGMLLVTHLTKDDFAARFVCPGGFIEFTGGRDTDESPRLESALARDMGAEVKSLRRDAHNEDQSCWLHGEGWCLSRCEPHS